MFDNSFKKQKKNITYNLKNKLLLEKKINKSLLRQINLLTIEELIALKLICSMESLRGKFGGFPLLKYGTDILKQSIIELALSVGDTKQEAADIANISKSELNRLIKLYNIEI